MAKSHSLGTTSCSANAPIIEELIALRPIQKIFSILGSDSKLYLVGGTVRDALLGKIGADIDLATILEPNKAKQKLEAHGIRVIETGIEHGTITAVVDEQNIEITTFRQPGHRSSSKYSQTIEEDLAGRDFTINAIACLVETATLIDPYNGIKDLENKLLKAVGDASIRFTEDSLRILRMVRFGSAEGRSIDPATRLAAKNHCQALKEVSIERVQGEIARILVAPHPKLAFEELLDIGVLDLFIPELLAGVGVEQNEFHKHDVFEHIMAVLQATPADLRLRLTAIFHDIAKPQTLSIGDDGRRHFYKHEDLGAKIAKEVMTRLRFPKDLTGEVSTLVQYHMRPFDCGPSAVRRLMRDLGDLFEPWKEFKVADAPPMMPLEEFEAQKSAFEKMEAEERLRQKGSVYGKLAVNGDDLIKLGLEPGVFLGSILKELENMVIETPESNDREILLTKAKEILEKEKANTK